MSDTTQSPLSSPPASDLAAANERGSAWRNLNDVIRSASAFVPLDLCNELEAACARMDRALSSLGDGDDSARPNPEQIVERAAQVCDRFGYANAGRKLREFSQQIIDAARTAPGGASHG